MNKRFTLGIGFEAGLCKDAVLGWSDGAAARLGYEASHEALADEMRELASALSAELGLEPTKRRVASEEWSFDWGAVQVAYEIKSNNCAVFINYHSSSS
jgi:hypothetical protein